MPVPNFLVIGDLKAGSSSLNYYLKQHPDIYLPPELKELRYFAYDKENPYHLSAKSSRVRTFEKYLAYFDAVNTEKAIGETSPSYLRSPVAANKIRNKIPDIKLVVCLRNPADRLYSLYLMGYRNGNIKCSFSEQLFSQDAVWIKGNSYWPDLKHYFDLFDEGQIKIVLFDDLKARTEETVSDLYRFLNVDDTFKPDFTIKNKGGIPKNRYWYAFLHSSKNHIKTFTNPPPAFKIIWAKMKIASLKESRLDPRLRKIILDVCEGDIRRTEGLIKRDLSMWFAAE